MEISVLPLRYIIRRRDESAAIKSTKAYRHWSSYAVDANSSLRFLPESFGKESSITASHHSDSVSAHHIIQSMLGVKDVIREDGKLRVMSSMTMKTTSSISSHLVSGDDEIRDLEKSLLKEIMKMGNFLRSFAKWKENCVIDVDQSNASPVCDSDVSLMCTDVKFCEIKLNDLGRTNIKIDLFILSVCAFRFVVLLYCNFASCF